MNQAFARQKQKMPPELRQRLDKLEAAGLYDRGKDYEKNRYSSDYMIAAWGEGYFPYLYQNRPDPNYDPWTTASCRGIFTAKCGALTVSSRLTAI
jgi:hypothetical protein